MPSAAENLDPIESTLNASLSKGRRLDQHVVSATQRVLMHNIQFESANSTHALQLSSLKSKYILLQPQSSATTSASSETEDMSAGQKGFASTLREGHDKSMVTSTPGPSGDAWTGESLPSPRVVIYPPERIKLEWHQMHRIGAGLYNMGNTCFLNSTLQCLTYTAPLVNYCLSEEHPRTCKQQGSCLMCELRHHIRLALQNGGQTLKPHTLLHRLKVIAKHMKWGRQEDAHEFLRYLVDGLQRACLNGYAKLDKFSKETTVINQIFGGFLRSQVVCMKCSARSNTYDPFMDLSLDIKGVSTVEDALAKYVKAETLDFDNAYKCEKCHQKVTAQKRFSIHKAPNVLTLQLNRFDFNRNAGKINRHIQFPERLNMRPYMSQKQGEPIFYSLYGVVVHCGFHCNSGHYYCYVKSPSKIWYWMNDSTVMTAPASKVFQAEAYLLFYSRVQPSTTQSSSKAPFIGPTSNGLKSSNRFSSVNGSHGKLAQSSDSVTSGRQSSELGVPISRQLVNPSSAPSAPPKSTLDKGSVLLPSHKKISFDIGTAKPYMAQQSQLVHKPNQEMSTSSSSPGEAKPRIVMHIKHGKVTTIEKSPDGVTKVMDGGQNASSSTLVPYDDDSDMDHDLSKEEHRVAEKSLASSRDDTRHSASSSVANSLPRKENGDMSENGASVRNNKIKAETLDNLTLKLNRDSGSEHLRRSMSIDTRSDGVLSPKVNATHSSWFIQPQDSAPSPSLGSCSSVNSNHSINSTTEWHVEDMKDSKAGCSVDHKLQHLGWTVSTSQDSKSSTLPSQADCSTTSAHVKLKSDQSEPSSYQCACKTVTEFGDAPRANRLVGGSSDGNLAAEGAGIGNSVSSGSEMFHSKVAGERYFSKSEHEKSSERIQCAKNFSAPEKNFHNSSIDCSDRQPLLSGGDHSDQVFSKKHKKKKHKHDKDRERSKLRYVELKESPSSVHSKKHKKKKHRHERDSSDSDHQAKRRRKRHRDADSDESCDEKQHHSKSSESEYTWEERTKESLGAPAEQVPGGSVPVHSWDHYDHHNRTDRQPIKAAWDGTCKSNVAEQLQKRPIVTSWEGGRSQADIEAERWHHRELKRNWTDHYEEDLDRGKVKKVKRHHQEGTYYNFNPYQRFQNDRNDKRWGMFDSHHKQPFHPAHNPFQSYGRSDSHSDPYHNSNYRDFYNRNGYSNNSYHRSYSHQAYTKYR